MLQPPDVVQSHINAGGVEHTRRKQLQGRGGGQEEERGGEEEGVTDRQEGADKGAGEG